MNTWRDTIADILRHHRKRHGIRDGATHCVCGWTSKDGGQHVLHQADLLLEATTQRTTPAEGDQ